MSHAVSITYERLVELTKKEKLVSKLQSELDLYHEVCKRHNVDSVTDAIGQRNGLLWLLIECSEEFEKCWDLPNGLEDRVKASIKQIQG